MSASVGYYYSAVACYELPQQPTALSSAFGTDDTLSPLSLSFPWFFLLLLIFYFFFCFCSLYISILFSMWYPLAENYFSQRFLHARASLTPCLAFSLYHYLPYLTLPPAFALTINRNMRLKAALLWSCHNRNNNCCRCCSCSFLCSRSVSDKEITGNMQYTQTRAVRKVGNFFDNYFLEKNSFLISCYFDTLRSSFIIIRQLRTNRSPI